jgi:hypothetical protein
VLAASAKERFCTTTISFPSANTNLFLIHQVVSSVSEEVGHSAGQGTKRRPIFQQHLFHLYLLQVIYAGEIRQFANNGAQPLINISTTVGCKSKPPSSTSRWLASRRWKTPLADPRHQQRHHCLHRSPETSSA